MRGWSSSLPARSVAQKGKSYIKKANEAEPLKKRSWVKFEGAAFEVVKVYKDGKHLDIEDDDGELTEHIDISEVEVIANPKSTRTEPEEEEAPAPRSRRGR